MDIGELKPGDRLRIKDVAPLYGEWAPQGLVNGNTVTVAHVFDDGVWCIPDNAKWWPPMGWRFLPQQVEAIT
ncbi:hypothetical protein RCIP0075_00041 [Klebsiella phage RCIP0075]